MLRLLGVVVLVMMSQTTFGQQTTKGDTLAPSETIINAEIRTDCAPIDYRVVMANLSRASKPGFMSRLFNSSAADSIRRFRLSHRLRAGFRREVGLLGVVSFIGEYSIGSISVDVGASVKGWCAVHLSGENSIGRGQAFSYDVAVERAPTYFYGLGYRAMRDNPRTTFQRVAQRVRLSFLESVERGLRLIFSVEYGEIKACELSGRAVQYLHQADESVLSVRSAALSCSAEYEKTFATGGNALFRLRLTQQIRPRALSNYPHTLWHTLLRTEYHCPLWRDAVMEFDVVGELWSRATPWLFWPSAGSDIRLRIYSHGRYVDRNMLASHIALHQWVFGPVGCEVWCGAVNMFSDKIVWRHTLPSLGVGVRARVGERLMVRVGYGFGRCAHGIIIGVKDTF